MSLSRKLQTLTVLGVASAALFASAVASAHQPLARAAAVCSVGTGEGLGYMYVTSLTVRGTNCATGRTLIKHKGDVDGWTCIKKRLATSPVAYDERETCTSGSRRVVWGYTENTA